MDADELETGCTVAAFVAHIRSLLSDAQTSLAAAEAEIGELIEQSELD